MSAFRRAVVVSAGVLATGCNAPVIPATPEERAVCARLLLSPPAQWPEATASAAALTRSAGTHLIALIEADPHAPGAPAATLLVGELLGSQASLPLQQLVSSAPEPVAIEAALALGRTGGGQTLLAAVANDPSRPSLLRTAAAAARTAQGRDPQMLAFLCDVILAASPQGRTRGLQLGLPVDRPRWAAERNLAAAALSHAAGQDLGIDADASWPDLAAAVARARLVLELPKP